jgi:uncharacterized membrane protein YqjE
MAEIPDEENGLLATVARMFKTLRAVAENRLELFLVELKEERARLFGILLLAAVGIVFALMTLVMFTLTVVIFFWDSHRLLALVIVTCIYAAGTFVTFLKLRERLQRWQAFSATLDQIKKDRSCFEKQI